MGYSNDSRPLVPSPFFNKGVHSGKLCDLLLAVSVGTSRFALIQALAHLTHGASTYSVV